MSDEPFDTVDEPAERSLSLEFDLPDAPDKVWRALTEPAIVARWILPDGVSAGADRPTYGLLDKEPHRLVSYRWREGKALDSVVTFSIAVNAVGGTRLTIVQSDLRSAALSMAGPLSCRFGYAARRSANAANVNVNAAFARAA